MFSRSLLNSKECLSCKVDFINITVWSKITLTCSHTDVLFVVHYLLYGAYKLKIYYKLEIYSKWQHVIEKQQSG